MPILLHNRNIRTDDVHSICIYLRSFGILDQADQDRIFNDSVFSNPVRKATELLTEIGKRGRHAYWYLAHALKTRHMAMFIFFHGGNFQCCGTYIANGVNLLSWYADILSPSDTPSFFEVADASKIYTLFYLEWIHSACFLIAINNTNYIIY